MSGIEELRRRVAEAEKRFGLINEQRSKYSERLVGLIDAVETRLLDQQAEIERHAAELTSQGQELESRRHEAAENQALRGMLHTLLQAIEAGSRDVLSETMRAMDAKVSVLIADSVALVPTLDLTPPGPDHRAPEIAPALQAPDLEAAETTVSETPIPEDQAPEAMEPDDPATAGVLDEPFVLETEDVEAPEAEPPQAVETEAAEAAEPEPAPDQVDELTEAQVAELLGAADQPEALDDVPAQATLEAPAAEDEPKAVLGTGAEAELPDALSPAPFETWPEDGEHLSVEDATPPSAAEDGMVASAAADDVMEPDGDLAEKTPGVPGIAAAYESGPVVADLVQEEAADPDYAAIGDAPDERSEAASLEDIMRRVSRLVEEDGALGPLAASAVQIGAGAQDYAPRVPSEGNPNPAPSKKTGSNG